MVLALGKPVLPADIRREMVVKLHKVTHLGASKSAECLSPDITSLN